MRMRQFEPEIWTTDLKTGVTSQSQHMQLQVRQSPESRQLSYSSFSQQAFLELFELAEGKSSLELDSLQVAISDLLGKS